MKFGSGPTSSIVGEGSITWRGMARDVVAVTRGCEANAPRPIVPENGNSPTFEITGATTDDARKRINALAASGCRTVLVSAPAAR